MMFEDPDLNLQVTAWHQSRRSARASSVTQAQHTRSGHLTGSGIMRLDRAEGIGESEFNLFLIPCINFLFF